MAHSGSVPFSIHYNNVSSNLANITILSILIIIIVLSHKTSKDLDLECLSTMVYIVKILFYLESTICTSYLGNAAVIY